MGVTYVLGCDPAALALPLDLHVIVVCFIFIGGRVDDSLHLFLEDVAMPKVSLHNLLLAHGCKPADVGRLVEAWSTST
jgi:hypothetical protein